MGDADVSEWLNKLVKETADNIDADTEVDSTVQAKRLLEQWAIQSENFRPEQKKTNKSKASVPKPKQKVAVYRKLDAPMVIAKKQVSDRPSVDPTLIMDARRAHVLEMKAKRIERQEQKQLQPKPAPVPSAPVKIDLPNVDDEISKLRRLTAEREAAKKRELEERKRQSIQIRKIEESAKQTIAKEMSERNRKVGKIAEKESKKTNTDNLAKNIQLVAMKQALRYTRRYFSIWTQRCKFNTQLYENAAAVSNFQKKSFAFSTWRRNYKLRVRQRELDMLEQRLRRDKMQEEQAIRMHEKNVLHEYFIKWSAKYKAVIEMRIIEEQHRKRRALLVNRIENSPPKSEKKKGSENSGSPKSARGENQNSPPKSIIPKSKPKPLKVDPRIAAMEKRAEEQRRKKLEKAQAAAQAAEAEEAERARLELEEKRRKRIEHREFLEQEKKKREDQKRMQEEYEAAVQRKKYIEVASAKFRLRRLQQNAFTEWARIIVIKRIMEQDAEIHYENSLKARALTAIKANYDEAEAQRSSVAETFYEGNLLSKALTVWSAANLHIRELEAEVEAVADKWCMRRALYKLEEERMKRKKAKYTMAAHHANKAMLKRFFKAWPEGLARIRDEERRSKERSNLMNKALRLFDELSDDDLF